MSYLLLPSGMPDFSKAVFSLWFRVPQATIDAARAAYDPAADPNPRLNGIIPLLVFGPTDIRKQLVGFPFVFTGGGYTLHFQRWIPCQWEEYDTDRILYSASQWQFSGEERDIDPFYIGIDCSSEENAVLSVNIQMPNHATLTGSWPHRTSTSGPSDLIRQGTVIYYPECTAFPPADPDGTLAPIRNVNFNYTYAGGADKVMSGRPELFRLLPTQDEQSFGEIDLGATGGQVVTAEQWHHLLLSFDLSDPCETTGRLLPAGAGTPEQGTQGSRTSSACRMWLAFDDVNLTGKNLSCYWPTGHDDPNAILTVNAYYQASDVVYQPANTSRDDNFGNMISENYLGFAEPACSYQPEPIQTGAIGLPATGTYVNGIRQVEMAELQIFTGVTLDTGVEINRRAFVNADGKPVNPSTARDFLGKRAEILLHGSSKWKEGRNTGSLGVDGEGNTIPAGQFQRTGVINQYRPDPSLHGPQSPARGGPVQLTKAAAAG